MANKILEALVILGISPKIPGVEQLEVLGYERPTIHLIPLRVAAIQANDGINALVGRVVHEMSFMRQVIGDDGFGPDDEDHAFWSARTTRTHSEGKHRHWTFDNVIERLKGVRSERVKAQGVEFELRASPDSQQQLILSLVSGKQS